MQLLDGEDCKGSVPVFRRLRSIFRVRSDQPDLMVSQLHAFSRLIPLLYCILLANTLFVSATHLAVAPAVLTIYLPLAFAVVCVLRLAWWWLLRNRQPEPAQAVARLRSTVGLAALLGAAFTAWGLAIFPYGDTYQQLHVAFYMAITVIACVFCLMHLRAAALVLSLMVVVPFALFFGSRGQPVLAAIAANLVLVAGAMLFVVFTHYRNFARMIAQQGEITRKQAETQRLSDENFQLANRDSLTGLPNRRRFFARIGERINQDEAAAGFAVGLVDLDGFKAVNDVYGHAAGDGLLVEASRRMQELVGWPVEFARIGGDEFGLILQDCHEAPEVEALGQALCEMLRQPYVMPGLTVEISASAGFAIYPSAGGTVAALTEHADYALYQAKLKRNGAPVIFSGEHATSIRWLNRVDQMLRNADFDSELSLAYQPIVETGTGRIVAFEALARWHNPALGSVAPGHFIKAAERSDLINRLTTALYRKALNDMADWPPQIGLSFNLSVRTLASPVTILQLIADTMKSGIAPQRIEFEVTETAIMVDFDQALQTLSRLKAIGFRIALDDFGSGYSSLGYVHRLPLDKIKIDSRFIADIETSATVRSIVKTIVDLSRNLGLACVAEGIETPSQAMIVEGLGCPLAQGYHFGRPGSAEIADDRCGIAGVPQAAERAANAF
jgi:diguanylate cyclase (GGDEF)-like protein